MKKATLLAIATAFAVAAYASPIRVADCERDADLDFWAAADNDVCVAIMQDVFAADLRVDDPVQHPGVDRID